KRKQRTQRFYPLLMKLVHFLEKVRQQEGLQTYWQLMERKWLLLGTQCLMVI
ncbi:unnamed protein product, partial [marine sediment metagenome]